MSKASGVAIVGVSSLVGDMLVNMLDEHEHSFSAVALVDVDDEAGERRMIKGQSVRVEALSGFDFSSVAVAIVAGEREFGLQCIGAIRDAGALVVDTTGLLAGQGASVVAEVNPQALADAAQRRAVSCPDAQVVQSALVLKALAGMSDLRRVSISTYQSMSTHSKAAVEGLAMQTGRLLNGQPIEKGGVLDKQVAFNLLPATSEIDASGASREERDLVNGVIDVLGLKDVPVLASCVLVPLFYGTAQMMQVTTAEPLDSKKVGNILRRVKGIKVLDKEGPGGFPTPVTEATGTDEVWVGRIRQDVTDPNTTHLWIVSDNLRKGVALNSLAVAGLLIKDYL